MKNTVLIIAIMLLFLPYAKAQYTANVGHGSKPVFSNIILPESIEYRNHLQRNRKMVAGGIVAGSGGVIVVSGFFVYFYLGFGPDTEHGEMNIPMQNLGAGMMVAGLAMTITGFVIMRMGHNEKKRKYGLELVAPKINEIGLAYNF